MTTYAGIVKMYNKRKNYGFIEPVWTVMRTSEDSVQLTRNPSNDVDIFVHRTNIQDEISEPSYVKLITGEIVCYEMETVEGKEKAVNVRGLHGTPLLYVNGSYRFKRRFLNEIESSSEQFEPVEPIEL